MSGMNHLSAEEINDILEQHHINDNIIYIHKINGTTDGVVYTLESSQGMKYILKFDDPELIKLVKDFLVIYERSALLPKIICCAEDHSYLMYTYIEGTTHVHRGEKVNWMITLTKQLFNKYNVYHSDTMWGEITSPSSSWLEFIDNRVEEARVHIGNLLSYDEYLYIRTLIDRLFVDNKVQGERYLLHGDAGVHNFVFNHNAITGVIDPYPTVGPIIYDFTFAFCSSPDDIDIHTLNTAYEHLEHVSMDRYRLIDEVAVQLYCRIGTSIKHHPDDLSEYLKAWEYWKKLDVSYDLDK